MDNHEHQEHKIQILQNYPFLENLSKEKRKDLMRTDLVMRADLRSRNTCLLKKISLQYFDYCSGLQPDALVLHIKTLLGALETPLQKHGHFHIRHTTKATISSIKHFTIIPSEYYASMFVDPSRIRVEHSGNGVRFMIDQTVIAKNGIKFESQSDPLSHIRGRSS